MKKDIEKSGAKTRIRLISLLAMLSAAGIVLGKLMQIPIGNSIRISFENLPAIFAGIALGPVCGAVVGLVEDICGSILVGYDINLLITLGAVSVGAVAGFAEKLCARLNVKGYPRSLLSVFPAHLIGSVIIKSAALRIAYGTPYSVLLLRVPIYLIVNVLAESALISVILGSEAVRGALQVFRSKTDGR